MINKILEQEISFFKKERVDETIIFFAINNL